MDIISQVARGMQKIMTETADKLARETEFVQRESKLTGSKFVQTLVFTWMSNPQASLEELSQTASSIEVKISSQGIEQRFTPEAGDFLQQVLSEAVMGMISNEGVNISIFNRFTGIYIEDSTTIRLPDALKDIWEGCGGSSDKGTSSSVKLQVRLNIKNGNLYGPILYDGRENDKGTSLGIEFLSKGSLRIFDLGYFSLRVLNDMVLKDLYWLCRLQAQTKVFDTLGKEWDVVDLLSKQKTNQVDLPIKIGADYRIPCRLLAVRVPEKISSKRRQDLHKEARRKGQAVSQKRLKMADWTIYITNAPLELMNLNEAMVLYRVRWQIELLFKLWKSHGSIDEWRSSKPYRILCELYGKLLVMIIQHWICLTSCWKNLNRSLRKAAKTIQKYALYLAVSCCSIIRLIKALKDVQRCLNSGCKINKRKEKPATFQLLLALEKEGGLA
jgi:hypothetical protein